MKTAFLPADETSIAHAGEIIAGGGLVAFPTETVYGLGANALDARAVDGIFRAKDRPADNPLIAHVNRIEDAHPLWISDLPEYAKKLAEAFWPGPLTIIYHKSDIVPPNVTCKMGTVAVRVPSHPVARALIAAAKCPIAAPSANRSGRPSPTEAGHVFEDMDGRIDMILDGGSCAVGLESTVVEVTGSVPRILRPGGITPEMIAKVAGSCEIDDTVLFPIKEGEAPRSPGTKYKHYAPKGHMVIVRGTPEAVRSAVLALIDSAEREGKKSAVLAAEHRAAAYTGQRFYPLGADASGSARALYAALRDMDADGIEAIFAEAMPDEGMGLAVMNRMRRAAAFRVVEAGEV